MTLAEQNDTFRRTLGSTTEVPGRVLFTPGVSAFGWPFVAAAAQAVAKFDSFTEDNDPYGEHDFGKLTVEGTDLFFKIDYYDLEYAMGSDDADNPAVTRRVLTIFLPEEY